MRENEDSPYMLLVAPVREDKRKDVNGDAKPVSRSCEADPLGRAGRSRTSIGRRGSRPSIPSATRGSHQVIARFKELTGCPVIINTSFNVRGEPIVCTPEDAWRCFMATEMDVLVIDRFVMEKTKQDARTSQQEREKHLAQFALD